MAGTRTWVPASVNLEDMMVAMGRRRALGLAAAAMAMGLGGQSKATTVTAEEAAVYTHEQYKAGRTEAFNDGYDIGLREGQNRHEMLRTSEAVVVGALYDFMGRLTTLDTPITVGSSIEVYDLMDAFQAWAKDRGLDINNADVEGWASRVDDAAALKAKPYVWWRYNDPSSQGGYRGDWAYIGSVEDPHAAALKLAGDDVIKHLGRPPQPGDDLLLQVDHVKIKVHPSGPRWADLPTWGD